MLRLFPSQPVATDDDSSSGDGNDGERHAAISGFASEASTAALFARLNDMEAENPGSGPKRRDDNPVSLTSVSVIVPGDKKGKPKRAPHQTQTLPPVRPQHQTQILPRRGSRAQSSSSDQDHASTSGFSVSSNLAKSKGYVKQQDEEDEEDEGDEVEDVRHKRKDLDHSHQSSHSQQSQRNGGPKPKKATAVGDVRGAKPERGRGLDKQQSRSRGSHQSDEESDEESEEESEEEEDEEDESDGEQKGRDREEEKCYFQHSQK